MTVPEGGGLVNEVVSLEVVCSVDVDIDEDAVDVDVGVNIDTLGTTIDEDGVDSVSLVAARRQYIKPLARR